MKLLLRESIRGVGKRGDIVDVTDGYARNYLLPKNLALHASQENLRRLAGEKRAYEAREVKARESAQEISDAISKIQLTVPMRASAEGHLFGSVTPKIIADAFTEEGVALKPAQIELESDHIRELGTYSFNIRLHDDVEVQSRVWIVAEIE
ncbi:MAG: 50S ribosomal protein L9 [Planctomycetes bacterium]|nr:50S ribosomal protein L9 [Planctomycetota bacterium]MCA8934919.1 50S ribosomal protein L9 [Planctomycetota bacterium]MCA8945467.1 50S ribosomal protein L9 [Planctomycetota bacterium]